MSVHNALTAALQAALANYTAHHPRSQALYQLAGQVHPGGDASSRAHPTPFPLTMVRGEGCWLWDADGHVYIDTLGDFTTGLLGHSNKVVRAAVQETLVSGLNLSSHTAPEVRLGQEIRRRFPSMASLCFTHSGSEANLMALAAATVHTGRRKVLVFDGGYHGGLLRFVGGISPANVPYDWVLAPYNDLHRASALVQQHGAQLAAIMVEPLQGAAGCIPGDTAFMQGLRNLANDCGALLVWDEVMTSRLALGGRQAQLGIVPDLTTLGQYVGGGLPLGVLGGRADVLARFDPRHPDALVYASNANHDVLTMAAAHAALSKVLTEPVLAAINARGDRLRERLNALFALEGVGLQATGLGSLMTLHAVDTPIHQVADLVGRDTRVKDLLYLDLLARGILIARRGMMALSLPLGEGECDAVLGAVWDSVRARRDVLPQRA